jgi:DNA-binding CsgD family transcriptional regulator
MLSTPEDELAAGRADLNLLSATERRIVSLVAVGRTDDEVCERLFLTRQTVAWSLAKICRKLGVGSREELAARVGAATRDEPTGSSHTDEREEP